MGRYRISANIVDKVREWLAVRGGVAVWGSCSLSSSGNDTLTPATHVDGSVATKPRYDSVLSRVITKADDIEVSVDSEVKRFHVATRMGTQGFFVKLTDGASRRVRREVAKAGDGAYHFFDYDDYENCVIMRSDKIVPFPEYIEDKVNV